MPCVDGNVAGVLGEGAQDRPFNGLKELFLTELFHWRTTVKNGCAECTCL